MMASLFIPVVVHAGIPSWAKNNSTRRTGENLITVCNGTGPSLDTARSSALKSCQLSASQFFAKHVSIKSVSVETEKSVGFHEEVSSHEIIEGLLCNPQRDEINEYESQFSVWIECQFNLKNVKIMSVDKNTINQNNNTLDRLKDRALSTRDEPSLVKKVTVVSIPKCSSIIVRGSKSRQINCTSNPIQIPLEDDDREIIVRANGYLPKTIDLSEGRNDEFLQVFLENN